MASINYNKYINSTGTHYIANSGGDLNGGIRGDKAGDQNSNKNLQKLADALKEYLQ